MEESICIDKMKISNDQMKNQDIFNMLPYEKPFLFVDTLDELSEEGVRGTFSYAEDSDFYRGHFKDMPVTPGVILTETMAQIGVVSLGIFLLRDKIENDFPKIAMTSTAIDFFIPVYPGEKVEVVSKKEVWRFGKLRCFVQMFNEKKELVCRGKISGMVQL
jgi:3-hydroxyacyl-[acyl-carrier-protein] dehydratase